MLRMGSDSVMPSSHCSTGRGSPALPPLKEGDAGAPGAIVAARGVKTPTAAARRPRRRSLSSCVLRGPPPDDLRLGCLSRIKSTDNITIGRASNKTRARGDFQRICRRGASSSFFLGGEAALFSSGGANSEKSQKGSSAAAFPSRSHPGKNNNNTNNETSPVTSPSVSPPRFAARRGHWRSRGAAHRPLLPLLLLHRRRSGVPQRPLLAGPGRRTNRPHPTVCFPRPPRDDLRPNKRRVFGRRKGVRPTSTKRWPSRATARQLEPLARHLAPACRARHAPVELGTPER